MCKREDFGLIKVWCFSLFTSCTWFHKTKSCFKVCMCAFVIFILLYYFFFTCHLWVFSNSIPERFYVMENNDFSPDAKHWFKGPLNVGKPSPKTAPWRGGSDGFFSLRTPMFCIHSFLFLNFLPSRSACGVLVPLSAIKPVPPAMKGRFLITGPVGESLSLSSFPKYLVTY